MEVVGQAEAVLALAVARPIGVAIVAIGVAILAMAVIVAIAAIAAMVAILTDLTTEGVIEVAIMAEEAIMAGM